MTRESLTHHTATFPGSRSSTGTPLALFAPARTCTPSLSMLSSQCFRRIGLTDHLRQSLASQSSLTWNSLGSPALSGSLSPPTWHECWDYSFFPQCPVFIGFSDTVGSGDSLHTRHYPPAICWPDVFLGLWLLICQNGCCFFRRFPHPLPLKACWTAWKDTGPDYWGHAMDGILQWLRLL